jgi:hypothetical protein
MYRVKVFSGGPTYLSDSFGKTSRAWKAVLLEKT